MRYLITLVFALLLQTIVAQQTYRVIRGERPAIDLQSAPESAYKKGVISIKINANFDRQLDESPVHTDDRGNVVFGIASIDQLNHNYNVKDFKKTFESAAFQTRFEERHRAWGFHRWYKIYFDESTDIKQMVQDYINSGAVEVAEPEYEKELVVNMKPADAPDDFSLKGTLWTPDDPRYEEQWHYNNTGQVNGTPDADIDLPEAWEITRGSADVIVAIIDQGVQINHPDLQAHMWPGNGWNFINNSPNIVAGDHGSHVAGTVSAINNNGVGVSGVAGGNGPDDGVRIMSCQVFNPTSGGGGFEMAPVWAADNGAAISQNSWGYTSQGYYEQAVLDAIDYFNVNGGGEALVDGGITIFSAGNSNASGQWYPGYYEGCFSVAAVNNQDKRSWYSNYDTWVDVAAPGGETDVVNARGVLSCWKNSNYGFYQGTSMACPHVSGVAALIASLAYGQFTPDQIADIIRNTTDNIDALNPGYVGKLGSGRINAFSALTETQSLMINVENPLAFTALAPSHIQINLNWVKNSDNNDVIIAYNESGVFGDPEQTVVYETGDTIPGGAMIIYKGDLTTFSHDGLSSNTQYFYSAWSFNDVNEYSQGIETSATTRRTPITAFPYLQTFDGELFPPLNWDNKFASGPGTGLWDRQTSGTDPDCLPQSGDAMVRFNSNDFEAGTSGLLITPPIQFAADGYEVSFWLYRDDAHLTSADKVDVYANLTPTTGFAAMLGTLNRSISLAPVVDSAGWYLYTFEIPETYYNKLAYIILKGSSDAGNNIFVDELMLEVPVNCFPPENIAVSSVTSTMANVSWTVVEPAVLWDVEVGETGFEPGSGVLYQSIENTELQLDQLEPDMTYDVYVRGACGDDGSSMWSGPVTFTTLCSAQLPWAESFEMQDSTFTCWQVMRNTAEDGGLDGNNLVPALENSWFVCSPESFEGQGADYIYEGIRSAAIQGPDTEFNWLVTGEISIPEFSKTDLTFRLKYILDGTEQPYFYVTVLDDGNWRTQLAYDYMEVQTNDFEFPVRLNMDAFSGKIVRIAFVVQPNAGSAIALDKISLNEAFNYWTGGNNTAWDETGNWRLNVPSVNDTAIIFDASNQPMVDGALEIESVQIHPQAALTLTSNAEVTVNGAFDNEAGPTSLILDNGATLIHHETGLELSTNYQGNAAAGLQGWQMIASPVTGQAIEPGFASAEDQLLKWSEPLSDWISARNPGGEWTPEFETEFTMGAAYLSAVANSGERTFAGTTTGDQFDIELLNSGSASQGWHLLGNPYTASYSWNPSVSGLAAIAKVYNSDAASFTDFYPGGIISEKSGFMVQVEPGATAAFSFLPENRTHAGALIPEPAADRILLTVQESQNNTSQQTIIRFDNQATAGYDNLLDSRFLAAFAPALYSLAGDEHLSTNTLPSLGSGSVVPIGFMKNEAEAYTLHLDMQPLYTDMLVYLNDIKTGTIHDFLANPVYNFSATEGDEANRFELIFGTLGLDNQTVVEGLLVYTHNHILYVVANEHIKADLMIHSLAGRSVLSAQIQGEKVSTTNLGNLSPGVYVVTIITEKGIVNRKVVVE